MHEVLVGKPARFLPCGKMIEVRLPRESGVLIHASRLPPMKILVGTPTAQGRVTARYFTSMRSLEKAVRETRPDISLDVILLADSFLPKSRNMLASVILNDPQISHLFFVDDDMGFQPSAFFKLLEFDKEFAGHICPARHIDLPAHYRMAREADNDAYVRSAAHSYVSTDKFILARMPDGGRQFLRQGSFVRTLAIGAGLTMMKRSVFERMADRCSDLVLDAHPEFESAGFRGRFLQCFAPLTVDGLALSEDLSFCHRWTKLCQGEIWACVDESITHVGIVEFTGRFIDKLRYQQDRSGARFDV